MEVFYDVNESVQMQMKHEENLMELQTMVGDPEGFNRIGGINYSDTAHPLSTL